MFYLGVDKDHVGRLNFVVSVFRCSGFDTCNFIEKEFGSYYFVFTVMCICDILCGSVLIDLFA